MVLMIFRFVVGVIVIHRSQDEDMTNRVTLCVITIAHSDRLLAVMKLPTPKRLLHKNASVSVFNRLGVGPAARSSPVARPVLVCTAYGTRFGFDFDFLDIPMLVVAMT
jgi:hypothetical protein